MLVVVVQLISPFEADAYLTAFFKGSTKIHCDSALKQKVIVYAEGIKAGQQGRNLIFMEQMSIIVRMVSIP